MKFGLRYCNAGRYIYPANAVELLQAGEAAGFESAWTVDHVVVPEGYKSAYPKHPMTLWVGQSPDNFAWTMIHGFELCKEYTFRYNKKHATEKIINDLYDVCKGDYMKKTEPPQCMPDKYKSKDYIQAYRNYYLGDKKRFARYTNRKPPEFMQ